MTAKPVALQGICTVYDCLDQWIAAYCVAAVVICGLVLWFNRDRWFR